LANRLKSKKIIDLLFYKGKSAFQYPIKVVYVPLSADSHYQELSLAYTVSKKNIKLAVHRNLIKRRMREVLRLDLEKHTDKPKWAMMYIYVGKETLDFAVIQRAIIKLNKKLFV
jgi:ribonuclease P protein component